MSIAIRSRKEIDLMKSAGQIVGQILATLHEQAQVGMTTQDLADISDRLIQEANAIPLFLGVPNPAAAFDFPSSLCVSVNEEIVHGLPGKRILKDGDIVSVDCGVKLKGYCGDSATTLQIGNVAPKVKDLLKVTKECLGIAIDHAAPDVMWSHVAGLMQKHAEDGGYGVVKEYVGHGIGRQLHEEPRIPNYVSSELKKNDLKLRKGMVIAVEPMLNMGSGSTKVLSDGWTVVTPDGKPSAHFEHTIAIVEGGVEVLTLL